MHADHVEETIELAGRELTLIRPASADALIDEKAFDDDEFLPYWAELWASGVALARAVGRSDLKGAHVLELGAGLGLPSLAAALRVRTSSRPTGPAMPSSFCASTPGATASSCGQSACDGTSPRRCSRAHRGTACSERISSTSRATRISSSRCCRFSVRTCCSPIPAGRSC